MDFDRASDEELVESARREAAPVSDACLETLYRRYYAKVAYWCLRVCGDRAEATDLAQEVFVRVHSRLDSFRSESRFSTWLYVVVRRVAINRGLYRQRRRETGLRPEEHAEPVEPAPGPVAMLETKEAAAELRRVMATELNPLEAKVLVLHHVDGLTLPAITELLGLDNRSGAKAFVVSGMRKLRRHFRDRGVAGEHEGRA